MIHVCMQREYSASKRLIATYRRAAGLPSGCHWLQRQQCVPPRVDFEKHAAVGSETQPADHQPSAAQASRKAAGGALLTCLAHFIVSRASTHQPHKPMCVSSNVLARWCLCGFRGMVQTLTHLSTSSQMRHYKTGPLRRCHRVLATAQVDEEPPIRANTTILLGNLADHLAESTQKRVLLNAFTRALKDLFPPARVAGLRVRPFRRRNPLPTAGTWWCRHTARPQHNTAFQL